jgi:hypothetical protein
MHREPTSVKMNGGARISSSYLKRFTRSLKKYFVVIDSTKIKNRRRTTALLSTSGSMYMEFGHRKPSCFASTLPQIDQVSGRRKGGLKDLKIAWIHADLLSEMTQNAMLLHITEH